MKPPRLIAITGVLALMAASFLFGRMSAGIDPATDEPGVAAEVQHTAPARPEANPGTPVEFMATEPERRTPEPVPEVAEKPSAEVPDVHPEENDEQRGFRRKYTGFGLRALEREREGLSAQLAQLTTPEYDACLRRGEYELVGKGTSYRADSWDNERMTAIRMEGGEEGRILKITLDERSHPDLYAVWRELRWMDARLSELAELPPSDAPRAK